MNKKLKNFLDRQKTKYKLTRHRTVYTAYDAAKTQGIELKQVAKTLLIKADNKYIFAVLPASKKLDLQKLKKAVNKYFEKTKEKKAKKLQIASERQIVKNFTKGKGALPSFGSLYRCQTFVDKSLLRNKKINLNAGSFEESLEMTSAMYKRIEKPQEASFGR